VSAAKITPPAAAPRAEPPQPGGSPATRPVRDPAAGLGPVQSGGASAKGGAVPAAEGEGTGGGKSQGIAAWTGEFAFPGKFDMLTRHVKLTMSYVHNLCVAV
jgi:hypothetical protein